MTQTHSLIQNPSKKGKPTARARKRLADTPPLEFHITNLAHDGRGVAVYEADNAAHNPDKAGKKVFISFALPGEAVLVKMTNSKKNFEEGDALQVVNHAHPQRQTPPCPHFGICGGCSLQHWQADAQIDFKQSVLKDLLIHQAGIEPDIWLEPLVGDRLGYRTKARMGVRYVAKKDSALVGFRERASNFLAELNECHILDERIGFELENLKALITDLNARDSIPQLEIAMGQTLPHVPDSIKSVAVIVRHMQKLDDETAYIVSIPKMLAQLR